MRNERDEKPFQRLVNGLKHCSTGPAQRTHNGALLYYIWTSEVSEEQFRTITKKAKQQGISLDDPIPALQLVGEIKEVDLEPFIRAFIRLPAIQP